MTLTEKEFLLVGLNTRGNHDWWRWWPKKCSTTN